ncbi:34-kDa subunit of RNA polymerase III (C) [Cladophialophora chaetospira]|uniref:34-kDa subunit of RNA polymerase III (C) n=1 Tax=Cladophialophora chaetospira TaxID=386627 RepID=A0AA38XN75_9EURO|nr:34-kDa subunit of RNA polymerase III (C) [Cladophialophora chaetospira]
MAPPKKKATASPTPGPSTAAAPPAPNPVGEALYAWATENEDPGYVFSQQELLGAGIIPNADVNLLLPTVDYLVKKSLFRLHDRVGGGIGWELVDAEVAKNYHGLNRHERIVLQVIEGAKNSGMWTKQIQTKTNLHQNTVEKIYKALEGRSLIKQMKSVAHPQRKMFISATLTPSEDATGGSWFSEGVLDQGLIGTISDVIESYVSKNSWQEEVLEDYEESVSGQKRKRPADGFDDHGNDRVKVTKAVDSQNKIKAVRHQGSARSYKPFEPGYKGYPTLRDITRYITDVKVTASALPQNAIAQLLQVMVYDDRLFKLSRPAQNSELADDFDKNTVTMYRCFKKPLELIEQRSLAKRKMSPDEKIRLSAYRHEELEALGPGGASEVPCMRCPVFDICGTGGPVNAVTCKYFTEWYDNIEVADREKKSKERDKEKVDKGKGKEKELPPPNDGRGPSIEIEMELEPS